MAPSAEEVMLGGQPMALAMRGEQVATGNPQMTLDGKPVALPLGDEQAPRSERRLACGGVPVVAVDWWEVMPGGAISHNWLLSTTGCCGPRRARRARRRLPAGSGPAGSRRRGPTSVRPPAKDRPR